MGRAKRWRVDRLPEKLLKIREDLDLTQEEMVNRLGLKNKIPRNNISFYETGEREPPIPIILAYAYCIGVHLEILVDDELELPKNYQANQNINKSLRRK